MGYRQSKGSEQQGNYSRAAGPTLFGGGGDTSVPHFLSLYQITKTHFFKRRVGFFMAMRLLLEWGGGGGVNVIYLNGTLFNSRGATSKGFI